MKSKKKILQIAKFLYKQSLTRGFVDSRKVHKILEMLTLKKTTGLKAILKTYKRLIMAKLKKEEVIVEAAEKITSATKLMAEIRQKTGARKVTFRTNPKITFGAKITHGDWIFDSTLDAKLKQLTINI